MSTPEWIVPGAKVVQYVMPLGSPRWKSRDVKTTTIIRVNQKSFTTEDGTRFSIRDQRHERGRWDPTDKVVDINSKEAREVIAEAKMRNAENAADRAYAAWQRDRKESDLLILINALQNIPRELSTDA